MRQVLPLARQVVTRPIGSRTAAQWPVTRPKHRFLQVRHPSSETKTLLNLFSDVMPPNLKTRIQSRVSTTRMPSSFLEPKAVLQQMPNLHHLAQSYPPRRLLMVPSHQQRLWFHLSRSHLHLQPLQAVKCRPLHQHPSHHHLTEPIL